MRFFEFLMCCFVAPIALALVAGMRPGVREIHLFCALLLVIAVVHMVWEGAHWQMAPAYLAVLALLTMGIVIRTFEAHGRLPLRALGLASLLLLGMTAVLSYIVPMFRLPAPTGPYPVGTRILYMVDTSRDGLGEAKGPNGAFGDRELMVQVWYPSAPSRNRFAVYRRRSETTLLSSYQSVLRTNSRLDAPLAKEGPWPLLLFNPAWTGQRTQSTFLMQELASQGFIVAGIDHTWYSGRVAFPDGRIADASRAPEIGNFEHATIAEQEALGAKYVHIEAEDDLFVLNRLAELNEYEHSPWHGGVDMSRVGALGHSIGGATSAEAALLDPRIKAVLNMDGWIFGNALQHGIDRPLMLMYERGSLTHPSTEELQHLPQAAQRYWQMEDENQQAVEASLHAFGGMRLAIDGTSHWNFSDRALYSPIRARSTAGPIAAQRAYSIIDRYALAFFSKYLRGTREPLLDGAREFPEVEFELWRDGAPLRGAMENPEFAITAETAEMVTP